MKKKKLLSLKTVMDSEIKGITWENVHVLGKNNIRQLVKSLREALREYKKLSTELLQPYKQVVRYTPENKEKRLLEATIQCLYQHRKKIIDHLVVISKKLPAMPTFPCLAKLPLTFGETFYQFDYAKGVWVDKFYFYCFPSSHLFPSSRLYEKWISLTELRLLQQQKKNKPFLALWKKQEPKGYNLNVLLAILLPTEEEMLEKRIAIATANMQSPEFSEVKDNLAILILQDKERLDVLRKDN